MIVEVCFGLRDRQVVREVAVEDGTTVGDAIALSNIQAYFPHIDMTPLAVGIFSRVVDRDTVCQAGDRIEIYRPLLVDPKQQRRTRAAQQREPS
ncbi:MAG: RnfH family protein [Gammaproteobacteria bacterium]|nr:RnfH family protein [Gammaproteobacteria bacterium]